jgi:REP-associated tyrosine transposase
VGKEADVMKGYHCAWQIHYHIVFPVEYGKALLDEEVVQIIKETALGIQERCAIEIEVMGMDKDHIHTLCGAHPKVSPGEIMQIFKSIAGWEIFRGKPSVKKGLWGGEFWTDGYYAATVGERANWTTVEKYIQEQVRPKEELKQQELFWIPCGLLQGDSFRIANIEKTKSLTKLPNFTNLSLQQLVANDQILKPGNLGPHLAIPNIGTLALSDTGKKITTYFSPPALIFSFKT